MIDIFKITTPEVCRKDQTDYKTAFVYGEMQTGEEIKKDDLPLNYLLFVLNGSLNVSCGNFKKRRFQTNEMTLLRRSSPVRIKATADTRLYVMYFDMFLSNCDRLLLPAYLPDAEKTTYDFSPITIPQPMRAFLDQLRFFQERGIDCMEFHALKHCEFFLLLRNFCSREEVGMLLTPLLGPSLDFRSKVLHACSQLEEYNVPELADKISMGRKTLDARFRKEFGMPPAKWIQQERATHIKTFLTQPGVTITDAIQKFRFNSSVHFNRFCYKHFNASPSSIVKDTSQVEK